MEEQIDEHSIRILENTFISETPPSDAHQKHIDKMTLELLVNKRQYRKYLEKCDPTGYDKKQEDYKLIQKYKYDIGSLFRDLLNDYSLSGNSIHLGNSEIHHIFEAFVQKSAYYFEEMRNCTSSPIDEFMEENTMFASIDEPLYRGENGLCNELFDDPTLSSDKYTAPFVNQFRDGNSFWGKNITKQR